MGNNSEGHEHVCVNGADEETVMAMCKTRMAPLEMKALGFLWHLPPVPDLTLGKHLSTS